MGEALTLRVQESLDHETAIAWTHLRSLQPSSRLGSSPRWISIVAKHDGYPIEHISLYQGRQLVGAATGNLMPREVGAHYSLASVLSGGSIVARNLTDVDAGIVMPALTLTSRGMRGCDIRLDPSLNREDSHRVLTFLLEAVASNGVKRGARSTALLFAPEHPALLSALAAANYSWAPSGSTVVLSVPEGGFEAHAAMQPHKRRGVMRSERRRVRNDPAVSFSTRLLSEAVQEDVDLWVGNLVKYGEVTLDSAPVISARIHDTAEAFGDDAFVVEMRREGRLLGAVLVLREGDILFTRYCGTRPGNRRSDAVYFNILFYEMLDVAEDLGVALLSYGPDLAQSKISRGATVEKLIVAVHNPDVAVQDRLAELRETLENPDEANRADDSSEIVFS